MQRPYRLRAPVKVTLTLDREVVARAKRAGLNMSRTCEEALLRVLS